MLLLLMKLISIDIFQTLVDIRPHKEKLWRSFLGKDFSSETAAAGWSLATKHIFRILEEMEAERYFSNLRHVFEMTYRNVFAELNLSVSPAFAAESLIDIHREAVLFDDTVSFIEDILKRYQICLSSDADENMVANLTGMFSASNIYLSENLKTYKIWKNNNFFSSIIKTELPKGA